MTPYVETRALPPGQRRWLAIAAVFLLAPPVSALMPGSDTAPIVRAGALLAVAILAPLLGIALGRARETITVDSDAALITRRTVGLLPDPRARTEQWPLASAERAELEELGTPHFPEWGVRILFPESEQLELTTSPIRDHAQDTLDHLVLLGIPGASRAAHRAAALAAGPPATWL